jgi:hypothetical protein
MVAISLVHLLFPIGNEAILPVQSMHNQSWSKRSLAYMIENFHKDHDVS